MPPSTAVCNQSLSAPEGRHRMKNKQLSASYLFQFWILDLSAEILVFLLCYKYQGCLPNSSLNLLEVVCVTKVTHSKLHWLNAPVCEVLSRPRWAVLTLKQHRTVAYPCQNQTAPVEIAVVLSVGFICIAELCKSGWSCVPIGLWKPQTGGCVFN